MAKSGLFITFEGTEGAGKSTLIRKVEELLKAPEAGSQRVVITREPGGSTVAEQIRGIILNHPMDPWTELFLYEASRAEHLARTVRPALQEDAIVLCDRFADSSLAYQAHARGLPWATVKTLNRIATQGLKPDLTILVDIDPAVGLERAREHNRFEAEGVEFQKLVRAGFLRAVKEDKKRWWILKQGSHTPDELAQIVLKYLTKRFKKRWNGKRRTSS